MIKATTVVAFIILVKQAVIMMIIFPYTSKSSIFKLPHLHQFTVSKKIQTSVYYFFHEIIKC